MTLFHIREIKQKYRTVIVAQRQPLVRSVVFKDGRCKAKSPREAQVAEMTEKSVCQFLTSTTAQIIEKI